MRARRMSAQHEQNCRTHKALKGCLRTQDVLCLHACMSKRMINFTCHRWTGTQRSEDTRAHLERARGRVDAGLVPALLAPAALGLQLRGSYGLRQLLRGADDPGLARPHNPVHAHMACGRAWREGARDAKLTAPAALRARTEGKCSKSTCTFAEGIDRCLGLHWQTWAQCRGLLACFCMCVRVKD